MLCFHIVKCTPFLLPPILYKDQKIAKKKQSKLLPHHDPIITRSRAREMSTNGPSTPKVSPIEFTQMKEQMSKLMRVMQQLVIGGGQNSFDHSQGGPRIENENQPPTSIGSGP